MRNFCGISLDFDKTFISFVGFAKNNFKFIDEIDLKLSFETDIVSFFKKNAVYISDRIKEKEKNYDFKIEKIFLELPSSFTTKTSVEEIVPLPKIKKISISDIKVAKKYIEDAVLNWDELCLHHFIESYQIDDKNYDLPPIGVYAKKIKIKSTLIYLKDKIYNEIDSILSDADLNFGGFVSSGISDFSIFFDKQPIRGDFIFINIRYKDSYFVVFKNGLPKIEQMFSLDLITLFQELSKKFSITFENAKNIFEQYFSFKEISYSKEISVRNINTYINISIGAFNSFIITYIKEKIELLLNEIKKDMNLEYFEIFFVGRLNSYEGIKEFFKNFGAIKFPPISVNSSSFGCVRYGLTRFLEDIYLNKSTLFGKFLKIYKEYF